MRDPERIDKFCDKLKECWHTVPDWRFGQLISNLYRNYGLGDGFFVEDDRMIEYLAEFFLTPSKEEQEAKKTMEEFEKFWKET